MFGCPLGSISSVLDWDPVKALLLHLVTYLPLSTFVVKITLYVFTAAFLVLTYSQHRREQGVFSPLLTSRFDRQMEKDV